MGVEGQDGEGADEVQPVERSMSIPLIFTIAPLQGTNLVASVYLLFVFRFSVSETSAALSLN